MALCAARSRLSRTASKIASSSAISAATAAATATIPVVEVSSSTAR
jgi:hypothetical protein